MRVPPRSEPRADRAAPPPPQRSLPLRTKAWQKKSASLRPNSPLPPYRRSVACLGLCRVQLTRTMPPTQQKKEASASSLLRENWVYLAGLLLCHHASRAAHLLRHSPLWNQGAWLLAFGNSLTLRAATLHSDPLHQATDLRVIPLFTHRLVSPPLFSNILLSSHCSPQSRQ